MKTNWGRQSRPTRKGIATVGRPRLLDAGGQDNLTSLHEQAFVSTEARCFAGLVARGQETLEGARALIGVPLRVRRVLEAAGYARTVAFRDKVGAAFERMVGHESTE